MSESNQAKPNTKLIKTLDVQHQPIQGENHWGHVCQAKGEGLGLRVEGWGIEGLGVEDKYVRPSTGDV